jgi:hypothetical protein
MNTPSPAPGRAPVHMPGRVPDDPYRDCSCADCTEYEAEAEGECEVFNAAVARLAEGFGDGIQVGPCTSKCLRFRPSDSLLRDLADAQAYRREQQLRESAWRNGAHA